MEDFILGTIGVLGALFIIAALAYKSGYAKGWNDLLEEVNGQRKANVIDFYTKRSVK